MVLAHGAALTMDALMLAAAEGAAEPWRLEPTVAALLLAMLAWSRQLPWSQALVVVLGAAGWAAACLYGWEQAGWPLHTLGRAGPGRWVENLLALIPWWLTARLLARALWGWREGRPRFGYELMLLAALLAVLPQALLLEGWRFPPALLLFAAATLLWQVFLTPWWLRKNPAPAPPDWLGPLAWIFLWGAARPEVSLRALVVLAPALAAWLAARRLTKAKAAPARA